MSCKHGNWEPCDECEAEEKEWREAFDAGKKEGWEACETCHGIVDGVHQQLAAVTAERNELKAALKTAHSVLVDNYNLKIPKVVAALAATEQKE